jgi:hypothetical protein
MLVIDGKYSNEDGMGTGRMYKGLLAYLQAVYTCH